MICSLRGTVMSKLANSAIIEVAGVGYAVGMSTASLATLPAVGDEAFVDPTDIDFAGSVFILNFQ